MLGSEIVFPRASAIGYHRFYVIRQSVDRGVAICGKCVDFATVEAVMWATIPTELCDEQGVTNGQVLVSTHVRITQR